MDTLIVQTPLPARDFGLRLWRRPSALGRCQQEEKNIRNSETIRFTTVQSPRSIYKTMELTNYVVCQCVTCMCRWEAMDARHSLCPMSGDVLHVQYNSYVQWPHFKGFRVRASLLFVASCDLWLFRMFATMGRPNPSKRSSVILWLQNVLKCRMNIAAVSGWTELLITYNYV